MNAFSTKNELGLLPTSRLSHAQHYAADRARRPTLVSRVAEYFKRQATMSELRQLTDRELADIGLQRSELHRVFEPGFAAIRR